MTDTDTTTKAPPAWMQREPMAREAVATALDICSRERGATHRQRSTATLTLSRGCARAP
jgi:hypothetical protein